MAQIDPELPLVGCDLSVEREAFDETRASGDVLHGFYGVLVPLVLLPTDVSGTIQLGEQRGERLGFGLPGREAYVVRFTDLRIVHQCAAVHIQQVCRHGTAGPQ